MLMVDKAAQETRDLVNQDFKKYLVLIVNRTGNVYGTSHVEDVIPRAMGRSAERCRNQLGLSSTDLVLNAQDRAPGHCNDKCKVTQETGLNKRRYEL